MGYLNVPEGEDALKHRAEMTAEYGVRTFNLLRTSWACPACSAPVPGPEAMVLPSLSLPSLARAGEVLASTTAAAAAESDGAGPCPRCGGKTHLVSADLHLFCSKLGRDLVVRFAPGQPLQTLSWSLADGYAPVQVTPELEQTVARDSVFRAIGVAREHDDYAAARPLIAGAVRSMPGDPMLVELMPWMTRVGDFELAATLADAYAGARPEDGAGHYWRGQLLMEAINRGRAPKTRLDEVGALFAKAIALRPDYPDALIGVANVARMQGREPDAERALRDLLARHPDHPEGNYTLGLVLLPRSPGEALGCFERGEAKAPSDADYPRSRARALLALGRLPEARAAIARARELAPGDPRVDQVAAQIASGRAIAVGPGPGATGAGGNGMSMAIKAIVAVVLVGVAVGVGVIVMGSMRAAQSAAPPAPQHPAAPAAPPAPAPARRR